MRDDKYIGYDTLEDWINDAETNLALVELHRQELIKTEKYQTEEKLGEAIYKDIFKSAHREVEGIDKKINWWKQLLGFLTELKKYREEKEND